MSKNTNNRKQNQSSNPPPKPPKRDTLASLLQDKKIDKAVEYINNGKFKSTTLAQTEYTKYENLVTKYADVQDQIRLFDAIRNSVATINSNNNLFNKADSLRKELDAKIKDLSTPPAAENNESASTPLIASKDGGAKKEPNNKASLNMKEEVKKSHNTTPEAQEKMSSSSDDPHVGDDNKLKLSTTPNQITPVEEEVSREEEGKQKTTNVPDATLKTLLIPSLEKAEFAKKATEILQQGNSQEFRGIVNENHINVFADNFKVCNLLELIEEKIELPSLKKEIYNSFINQSETTKEKGANVELFRAESLNALAKLIFALNEDKSMDPAVKKENFSKAIKLLDKANIICVNNSLVSKDFQALSEEILNNISQHISSYSHNEHAYELSLESLAAREECKSLDKNTPTMLRALLSAAESGLKVASYEDHKTTTEVLNHCLSAQNICTALQNNEARVKIYELMATLYKEKLHDEYKPNTMSAFSKAYNSGNFEINIKDNNEPDNSENISKNTSFTLKPVIKFGVVSAEELEIKKIIQESILNKIYDQAKDGKWTHQTLLWGAENGVAKYIDDKFIREILPEGLQEDKHIETVHKLCLDTINTAIINTIINGQVPNIICTVRFSEKYSNLLEKVTQDNPECLSDEYILKIVKFDAHLFSKEITGTTLQPNTTHNQYLENEILKAIHGREKFKVFEEIQVLIKSGTWGEAQKVELQKYLSEEYLIGESTFGYVQGSTSALGRNLGGIKGIIDIVRVEAYSTVVKSLVDTNNAPLKAFFEIINKSSDNHEEVKKLIARIQEKNPDTLSNENMKSAAYQPFNEVFKGLDVTGSVFIGRVDMPSDKEISLAGEGVEDQGGPSGT